MDTPATPERVYWAIERARARVEVLVTKE
jgi:xanthine dehydrogenase molybdopterin-binding subunit B